jgi:hypothetical protein
MLKQPASFILASFSPSIYSRWYTLAFHSVRPCPKNALSILRERLLLAQTCREGFPWFAHMLVPNFSDRLRLPR